MIPLSTTAINSHGGGSEMSRDLAHLAFLFHYYAPLYWNECVYASDERMKGCASVARVHTTYTELLSYLIWTRCFSRLEQ